MDKRRIICRLWLWLVKHGRFIELLVDTCKDLRQNLSMPLLHFECPHIPSKIRHSQPTEKNLSKKVTNVGQILCKLNLAKNKIKLEKQRNLGPFLTWTAIQTNQDLVNWISACKIQLRVWNNLIAFPNFPLSSGTRNRMSSAQARLDLYCIHVLPILE